MAYYLLTTDLHLDDNPDNEYRWQILEQIYQATCQYRIAAVFVLGDAWDRKDRHSAALVNRTTTGFQYIGQRVPLVVLRGNHDRPMHDPAFWEFLNDYPGVAYISNPQEWVSDLLLLPYSPAPKADWAALRLSQYKAIFMHATVTGAVVENGQTLTNDNFPILPRAAKIYSGDIHVPQQIRNITYVGAPYPIRFGDTFRCRMLLLDEDFNIALEIPLRGPQKLMLTINSVQDLAQVRVNPGDQVKVRVNLPPGAMDGWAVMESAIGSWAQQHGIAVAGTEVLVDSVQHDVDTAQTPEAILRALAESERLSPELLQAGLDLLRQA